MFMDTWMDVQPAAITQSNTQRATRRERHPIAFCVASLLAFFWLVPLAWVILVSFKPQGSNVMNATGWVTPPYTIENYIEVFTKAPVALWIWNSFLVAVITTFLALLLSTLCAFPFSLGSFFGSRFLMFLIAIGLMVPGEATLIPLYVVFRNLNWLDSYQALILPGIAIPFGVLLLKQFFDGLPRELFEAAMMDGCGIVRMLFQIAVPLSRPALAALGIFTFLGSWNNFLWPFISTTSPQIMTIPVGIPFFNSSYHTDYTLPMAANVVVSVPVLVAFLLFQKQIIKGISFTGLK
ncbi:sugar ABC transporter permease [Alicyclobacillus cellulosilyticus]|uniref:Sugar ABC transporter permease n=1 Tax=Alicyclobacillus cellulosilyticus TaxID=1003997 RepID=A0A917NKP9_9BACL|nr:carbohydrate ABC transporter permease [Alicyclobacillus cellulosilyticus]GGJ08419.1 sugar ABC transporter permease [Alicyclobacillus cellulosilyticus]